MPATRTPRDRLPAHIEHARARAEVLVDTDAVRRAIDRVSIRVSLDLQAANPLLLVVMHGGLPFAGELIRRLAFPLEYGYLHVGRYGTATRGGELRWHAQPSYDLTGRTVLLVDDVLDRGTTLAALREWARAGGAGQVLTAVLVDKRSTGARTEQADYAALVCPDRYLFGCGMDYQGYWRNLPAIYALPDDLEDP